jgi:hypothetical protein
MARMAPDVDDQSILYEAEPTRVVTAAFDGERQSLVAGEPEGFDNVSRVGTPDDGGGARADAGVEEDAGRLVSGVEGREQLSADGLSKGREVWPHRKRPSHTSTDPGRSCHRGRGTATAALVAR